MVVESSRIFFPLLDFTFPNSNFFPALMCVVQAVTQNALWGPTSVLQLWFLRQNRAFQSFLLPGGHRQSPQSQWQLWRQWWLHQRQRTPSRPGLTSHVQPGHAGRRRFLPPPLRGLLRRHGWWLDNQVRVHAQCHSQEVVPGVRWHCLRLPLRRGLLWGLQSLFQKDDTRYFPPPPLLFVIGSPQLISTFIMLSVQLEEMVFSVMSQAVELP